MTLLMTDDGQNISPELKVRALPYFLDDSVLLQIYANVMAAAKSCTFEPATVLEEYCEEEK